MEHIKRKNNVQDLQQLIIKMDINKMDYMHKDEVEGTSLSIFDKKGNKIKR